METLTRRAVITAETPKLEGRCYCQGVAAPDSGMRILAVTMALIGSATAASAQLRDTTGIGEAIRPLVEHDRIRLSALGTRWSGAFTRITGDTLYIISSRQTAVGIQVADIDSLWEAVEAPNNGARAGAVIGAGIVGFAGFVVVGLAGAEGGGSNISGSTLLGGLLGAVVGAAVGSFIGAAIGRGGRRWELVYAR
jgi:hypothetical protein